MTKKWLKNDSKNFSVVPGVLYQPTYSVDPLIKSNSEYHQIIIPFVDKT